VSGSNPFPLAEVIPAISRLRQIAAEAADHLLLGDGPPHPDAALLDVCGELLSAMRRHRELWEDRRALFGWLEPPPEAEIDRRRRREKEIDAELEPIDSRIRSLLSRAKRLHAATAAGIYGKALVVRASRSGAVMLAMGLAEDLVNNPALRASLWAADPGPAPDLPGNVVALAPRTVRRAET
jgi:hypothetical protein